MPPKTDESQNIKITKLEGIMDQLKEGFKEIKAEFKEFDEKNDKAHLDITAKIDKFIDAADERYASKEVEKAMWWLIFAVGTAIIGIVTRLIVK